MHDMGPGSAEPVSAMSAEWVLAAAAVMGPLLSAAAAFGAVRAGFKTEVHRLDEKADTAQQTARRAHDRIDQIRTA